MGSLLRPDPNRRDMIGTPDAPATGEPKERTPFEFVERPRGEPEVYISRPHLGRDPAESPAESGLDEPAVWAVPEGDPEEPKAFEFVERPRVEPEIYVSRPELGRDPAQTPANGGGRVGEPPPPPTPRAPPPPRGGTGAC